MAGDRAQGAGGEHEASGREVGPRRHAREAALQMLYGLDVAGDSEPSVVADVIRAYWAHMEAPADGRPYADELFSGVARERAAIDDAIRAANPAWRVERMSVVDRNVIRIATFEILHCGDVPASVAIDEAVDLARRFGGDESPAFVNGTLDRIARNAGRL